MSLEDFTEGYLHTLRWCASNAARATLKRDPTREELTTDQTLQSELSDLWSRFGASVDSARGFVGMRRALGWQAGHDLAFVQNGRRGFASEQWGRLGADLTTEAQILGKRTIAVKDGAVIVSREQQKREG